jgi:hypothetical protein
MEDMAEASGFVGMALRPWGNSEALMRWPPRRSPSRCARRPAPPT